jgi:hypothetical protein
MGLQVESLKLIRFYGLCLMKESFRKNNIIASTLYAKRQDVGLSSSGILRDLENRDAGPSAA